MQIGKNKSKELSIYMLRKEIWQAVFFVSEKKQEQMCDYIDRKVSM